MKKIIVTLTLLAITASYAQPQGGQGGPGSGKPPKEAIAACKNKDKGTSCSVNTPRGDTLEGTCKNTPDDKYFVCMPNNHRKE
ncbi:hypothetical protein [Sulfurovum sp.]|uniref:hypothetical protein n=1 Tax=Sulfurovum sp. TaxID=1969726 RepID=UPI002867ECE8|nr:hypothetical protein [Sulfurovum sp.]